MDKTYTKEEVSNIVLAYERTNRAADGGADANEWLAIRGFDKPTPPNDELLFGEVNKRSKPYSIQEEIERKEREVARKDLDRLNSIEASGKAAMDGINKEWVDGRDSLDKVMKAIDKVEDRLNENSSYIDTNQRAINVLLDDMILRGKSKSKYSIVNRIMNKIRTGR